MKRPPDRVYFILSLSVVAAGRALWARPLFGLTWWGKRKFVDILGILAMAIAVIGTRNIIVKLLGPLHYLNEHLVMAPFGAIFVVYAILIVLIAPLVEELFFRGYAQRCIEKGFGRFIAIPVQALLFALAHNKNLSGMIDVFVVGIIFGLWRYRRKTLIPLIFTHMLINVVPGIRYVRMYVQSRDIKITRHYEAEIEGSRLLAGTESVIKPHGLRIHSTSKS